ncbi:hypothetical protein HDU76_007401 [Blyttiomyces sp. JEL0837]|nr:hypothetical protein HDU76_007401 [Blyttiomyces sp. JEL0837]
MSSRPPAVAGANNSTIPPTTTTTTTTTNANTNPKSEDIIRFIIRDIVSHASTVLKQRRTQQLEELQQKSAITTDESPPTTQQATSSEQPPAVPQPAQLQATGPTTTMGHPEPPMTPMPDAKHLFTSGIKSHVAPHIVSDTLAAFVVRAVVLDPRNDFRIERELTKEEVERLIKLCVEKITTTNNIVMETVKMQVYFDTIFPAQADYLHREKMSRISSCAAILREITEIKTKNISIYEGLYRKIVSFILMRSHVGNPTDMRVVREATAALESVFPQSELASFISLSRGEKEAQLNGLTQLVTGIRLFNKQLGKGGDTVDDSELHALSTELDTQTTKTENSIQTYMAVIDYTTKALELELSPSSINKVKTAIVFYRQYLMYLDALHDQVSRTRESLQALGQRYDDTINDLKATCKSKTAVPVDQVYPQFIALANMWSTWMDELFLLAFRRGIIDQIDYHAKSFQLSIPEKTLQESESFKKDIEPEMLSEGDIIAKATELMAAITIINKTVEVVHPGNTTQYFKLPVEYGNLGMLRYRDRLFAFSSQESAREFAKFPDRYMEGVLEMAKRSPDLVQLLHLYSYFPTVDALENAKSFTRQRLMGQMPMVSEVGTQVDTHIVDTYFDSKYQWNEWELRRHALMLVNLKQKQTHSAQTDISHFRRESETQHYAPKTNYTQTYTESSTNVPKKVNYLAGLRNDGDPKNRFRVIDLTLDL